MGVLLVRVRDCRRSVDPEAISRPLSHKVVRGPDVAALVNPHTRTVAHPLPEVVDHVVRDDMVAVDVTVRRTAPESSCRRPGVGPVDVNAAKACALDPIALNAHALRVALEPDRGEPSVLEHTSTNLGGEGEGKEVRVNWKVQSSDLSVREVTAPRCRWRSRCESCLP